MSSSRQTQSHRKTSWTDYLIARYAFLSFSIHGGLRTDSECQVRCLATTLPITLCSPDDFGCLCTDVKFMTASGTCTMANCSVVEMLRATNETYAACGIPVRDQSRTLMAVVASIGTLALLMVIMRLVDRTISRNVKPGWDDLLIGLSGVRSFFPVSL